MDSMSMYMSSSEEERKIEIAILLNCSLESFKIHDIF